MIDDKNIIYYPKEASMIPQPIQENMSIPPTPYESQIDYESKKDESSSGHSGRWEPKEHIMFLGGCLQYGNNWKKVEAYVKTRTSTQIRSHAQKFLKKLEKKYISNGSAQNPNTTSYDNVSEELINNNILSQNKESPIKTEEIKQETLKINENNTPEENNISKENNQTLSLKNDEITVNDNKTKLSEDVIRKLVEELPKPGFNIEIVEKIILRIFRLNKKMDDFPKPEINIKKSVQKNNNGTSKNNKNIFLCQKLKRDINYDAQIKELLSSNNQEDLRKLFKIFEQERDSIRYNILMKNINDN